MQAMDAASSTRRRKRDGGAFSSAASAADVPFARRRTSESEFAALVAVAVDEAQPLSARMERAVAMWQRLQAADAPSVAAAAEREPFLMLRMVDALLSTAYFPLQQFYFMALAGLLHWLQRARDAPSAAALMRFERSTRHFDARVARLLAVREPVDWLDPKTAREHVNALNECTQLSRAFRVLKCWGSESDASALRRMHIDGWVDVGGAMLCFYEKLPRETKVINIPAACVERVERDEPNGLVYIHTKRTFRTDGASLFVFETSLEDYASFSKAVVDLLAAAARGDCENLKALVSDEMFERVSPARVSSRVDTNPRMQHSDIFASASDDEARSELLRDRITSDLLRFLGDDVYDSHRRLRRGSTSAPTSSASQVRVTGTSWSRTPGDSASSSVLTSASRQISSSSRAYSIPSSTDSAQQQEQRLLDLIQRERDVRASHGDCDGCCSDLDNDLRDDNGASADAEGDSKAYRVVVLLTVSAMLVPWLLFVVLYVSGAIAEVQGAVRAAFNPQTH